jgi:prefoldin alpha subunit
MNMMDEQQKLAYETAVYREQLNLLHKEIDRITLAMLDLNNAVRTTEKLVSGDSLVPIGGGAYTRAVVSSNTLLVPIGAGYVVELKREVAGAELKKRVESTEKALQRLNTEVVSISQKFQEANNKLRDIASQNAINRNAEENIREDYI